MDYVALLRGINVGGRNPIKMAALKTCVESMGYREVATYIQSGNVLFESDVKNRKDLTDHFERCLSAQFRYSSCVVVVSHDELKRAVQQAPKGFGRNPAAFRYDVIFLKPPLTASQAIREIPVKEGVDTANAGKSVLYFSKLIKKASQSRLSRITQLPIYQHMTIRNWNTTTQLLALMEARGSRHS